MEQENWETIHKEITLYLPSGMKDFEIENLCKGIQSLLQDQQESIAVFLEKEYENGDPECSYDTGNAYQCGLYDASISSAESIRNGDYKIKE